MVADLDAFADAVNASLADSGVETSTITSFSVVPGSIVVTVMGWTLTIQQVNAAATSSFSVTFRNVDYQLANPSAPSGSRSLQIKTMPIDILS